MVRKWELKKNQVKKILLNLFLYIKHLFSLLYYVTWVNNPSHCPKQVFLGTCGLITGFAHSGNSGMLSFPNDIAQIFIKMLLLG